MKWIWLSDESVQEDVYAEFRIPFETQEESLWLELSAHTDYAVYLNDRFVYSGQYADMPWYKIKDRLPLAPKQGSNVLTIYVYYGGDPNFHHKVGKPMLWFALENKTKILATSDESIASRLAPGIRSGEKKVITWQLGYSFCLDPNEKGGEYAPSKVVEGPETLFLRPIERMVYEVPRMMTPLPHHVYDAGEESLGVPYIKATIPMGKTLVVAFGEWLNEEGNVAQHIGSRDFSFELVGNGQETLYTNPFAKYGFRYFQGKGEGDIHAVGWIPVHYPFHVVSRQFSSPLRQKIYDTGVRTLERNALDHYFDCPWREQGFYALDSRCQMRYGAYAFEGYTYQREALKLMSEDHSPKGLLSITVPTDDPEVIPSFALYYVVAMDEYASYSQDTSLLKEYLPKMKSIVDQVLAQSRNDGLLENFPEPTYWNFYEWNPGLDGWPAGGKVDACLNFTAIFALQHLIAAMRRCEENPKEYEAKELALKQAVTRYFWDDERKLFKTYLTGGYHALVNAYALLTDTVPQEDVITLADTLTHPTSDIVPCTLSMLSVEYDALLHTGKARYRDFVLQDIDQKFGMMLAKGATTFWETLKGKDDFDGAGSLCHGWSALPVYYYPLLNA